MHNMSTYCYTHIHDVNSCKEMLHDLNCPCCPVCRGMDGRVHHPRTKKEMAYVVALGGKDYRESVLKDAKTSLIIIAGGDPDMRQALSDGVVKQAQVRINGTDMYIYDLRSDKRHYLSTIGKKGDTVYALVVTAPSNAYEKDVAGLRHIQETFQLL
eukprot:GHUV01009927.1.p1 GENE.GHUV01009927.1~~GHUV01009927.1.p1  ORF type:complete len:156 (+),score=41.08 GHUV01009927.1:984-1451(+)